MVPGASMRRSEAGHLLVGLMVLIAVMMILMTVAAQSWVFIMRRDAEAEMIFRGEEYARALQFYKIELGSYPLDLKVLMQKGPHRHRYIRRLYKDPLASDGTWGKLYLSPTGKGFINPYASRRGADPFGNPADGPFPGGGPRAGGGLNPLSDPMAAMDGLRPRNKPGEDQEDPSGYSELTPEEFEARGGEQQGLPIVGVVHKTKESGLKIYKNLANLNDWAFTVLLDGQETLGQPAGAGPNAPQRPLQQGIGDHTNPFSLGPQQSGPKEKNLFKEFIDKRRKAAQDQRDKEQKEGAESDDQAIEEDYPPEDEPPLDDESQEEPDDGEEQDPNAPDDARL